MDTGQSSSGHSSNFDQYGNQIYSSYDLMMLVFGAWVKDNLRWILQGKRYRRPGDVRWTTINKYAPLCFWRIAQKYLRESGIDYWLIIEQGPDDRGRWRVTFQGIKNE